MALTRTARIASTSGAGHGAGAYTSAAFTPSNNSLLVVIGMGITTTDGGFRGTDLTVTDSVGLTWTSRAATTASPNWSYGVRIWTAPVTTGASMTVSIDAGAFSMEYYRLVIVDYTSTTTSAEATTNSIVGSDADGDGAATITLPSAPASASEVIAAAATAVTSGATGTVTVGTGWTELNDAYASGWMIFQTQTRTGSTSASVTWDDLCVTATPAGAALAAYEIAEASAGGGGGVSFRLSLLGVGR